MKLRRPSAIIIDNLSRPDSCLIIGMRLCNSNFASASFITSNELWTNYGLAIIVLSQKSIAQLDAPVDATVDEQIDAPVESTELMH